MISFKGDCNEDILNSNTAISEMHVPPLNMSIRDQVSFVSIIDRSLFLEIY